MRATYVGEEAERLKERTERLALGVFELIRTLPATEPGPTIRRQLSKSATSVAANYRATCRARTHAEFTARMGIVAEEADESLFWLGLLSKAKLTSSSSLPQLQQEVRKLVAGFRQPSALRGALNAHRRSRRPFPVTQGNYPVHKPNYSFVNVNRWSGNVGQYTRAPKPAVAKKM